MLKERGYTLLLAIIISSIILSIGLSILNITLKEFILSAFARESEIAFYAADAGIECALYWDENTRDRFATSGIPSNIQCAGASVKEYGSGDDLVGTVDQAVGGNPYGTPNTFGFKWGFPEICVLVSVTKHDSASSATCLPGAVCTNIISRGYNGCSLANPRIVERALRTSY